MLTMPAEDTLEDFLDEFDPFGGREPEGEQEIQVPWEDPDGDPSELLRLLTQSQEPIPEKRVPTKEISPTDCSLFPLWTEEEVAAATQRLVRKLQASGPFSFLDNCESFHGDGVYALYYQGDIPIYQPIRSMGSTFPIYVGKAVQPDNQRNCLFRRLKAHETTLQQAHLPLGDFTFRFICLSPSVVEFSEYNLIRSFFQPIWNVYLKGFGAKSGAYAGHGHQEYPTTLWDTFHPGRSLSKRPQRDVEPVERGLRRAVQTSRMRYDRIVADRGLLV